MFTTFFHSPFIRGLVLIQQLARLGEVECTTLDATQRHTKNTFKIWYFSLVFCFFSSKTNNLTKRSAQCTLCTPFYCSFKLKKYGIAESSQATTAEGKWILNAKQCLPMTIQNQEHGVLSYCSIKYYELTFSRNIKVPFSYFQQPNVLWAC